MSTTTSPDFSPIISGVKTEIGSLSGLEDKADLERQLTALEALITADPSLSKKGAIDTVLNQINALSGAVATAKKREAAAAAAAAAGPPPTPEQKLEKAKNIGGIPLKDFSSVFGTSEEMSQARERRKGSIIDDWFAPRGTTLTDLNTLEGTLATLIRTGKIDQTMADEIRSEAIGRINSRIQQIAREYDAGQMTDTQITNLRNSSQNIYFQEQIDKQVLKSDLKTKGEDLKTSAIPAGTETFRSVEARLLRELPEYQTAPADVRAAFGDFMRALDEKEATKRSSEKQNVNLAIAEQEKAKAEIEYQQRLKVWKVLKFMGPPMIMGALLGGGIGLLYGNAGTAIFGAAIGMGVAGGVKGIEAAMGKLKVDMKDVDVLVEKSKKKITDMQEAIANIKVVSQEDVAKAKVLAADLISQVYKDLVPDNKYTIEQIKEVFRRSLGVSALDKLMADVNNQMGIQAARA